MGRIKEGNYSTEKINSMQDFMRKEENVYPVPDTKKIMINITNEPSNAH
jgi:hypothetical protein